MIIAIYAGSFDPLTRGHLEVIRRAARLFDHVRVLVAQNPNKNTVFSLEERVELTAKQVASFVNVSVDGTYGLTVDYARSVGATVLLRGFRDGGDAESEAQLAQLNEALAPDIQSVLIPSPKGLCEVSSSGLKRKLMEGDDVSEWLDDDVASTLRERLLGAATDEVPA